MRKLSPRNQHLLPKSATEQEWKELLISLMRECAEKNDKLSYNLFRDFIPNRNLARSCERIFGSWNEALRAAGFPVKKRWRINDTYILNSIKKCYNENGYVTYSMLEDTKKCGVSVTTIERHFGSFNNALKRANVPVHRSAGYFAHPRVAKDGHKCDSIAESIIDNWLYEHKVKHYIHYEYPHDDMFNNGFNNHMQCDFYLPDNNVYIEYFGMSSINAKTAKYRAIRKRYRTTITRKMALCNKLNISLICIYHNDLRNLDKCLKQLKTPSI